MRLNVPFVSETFIVLGHHKEILTVKLIVIMIMTITAMTTTCDDDDQFRR